MVYLTQIIIPTEAYYCFLSTFEDGQIPVTEFFYVMTLNKGNRFLWIYKVSEGGITKTIVDIHIVVKFLLDVQASSAIICHNHPSGTLKPSQPGLEITQKIKCALELFEIVLHDHIIITIAGYYSMCENGKI